MKSFAALSVLLLLAFEAVSAANTVTKTVTKTKACNPQTVFKTTTVTKNTCAPSSTSAGSCKSTNPVVNPGFETGTLKGWLTTSDTQPGTTLSITAKAPGSNNNKAGTASKYAAYFSTNWTEVQNQAVNTEMLQKVYLCAGVTYDVTYDYQFDPNFNTPMQLAYVIYYEESGQTLNFLYISAQPGSENDNHGNPIVKGVWYTASDFFTAQSASYPHTISFTSTCYDQQAATSRTSGYCGVAVDNVIFTPRAS